MNSAIIGGNALYQTQLHEFLTPAVGSHPQWLLCFRACTHGWAASTFHSRCDGKRNTVTIIKVGQYVFGGYTDIPWGKWNIFTNWHLCYANLLFFTKNSHAWLNSTQMHIIIIMYFEKFFAFFFFFRFLCAIDDHFWWRIWALVTEPGWSR